MEQNYYTSTIKSGTNYQIGIVLGQAIKDAQVSPEFYNHLCKLSKDNGFEFRYIEFVK